MANQSLPGPCPRCGSEPNRGYYGPEGFYIECLNDDCPDKPSVTGHSSAIKAVDAWNKMRRDFVDRY